MSILQIFDTGSGYKLVNPEATEIGGGGTTGAVSLDLTTSRNFDVTATGSITWTFANPPSGSKLTTTFKVVLVNGGLGTQTWPASVTWLVGSTPTLKSSGTNILQFTTRDNGTSWIGVDITPNATLAATSYSSTDAQTTGFTLDASGLVNKIEFMYTTATGTTNPIAIEYSNDNGVTWSALIPTSIVNTQLFAPNHRAGWVEIKMLYTNKWNYHVKTYPMDQGSYKSNAALEASHYNTVAPWTSILPSAKFRIRPGAGAITIVIYGFKVIY